MTLRRTPSADALLFFLAAFVALSSGRIASADAGQQLQVAVMLALTGQVSDGGAPGGPATSGWVRGVNGRLYQAHDIGNIVLMLPAAWAGAHLSRASTAEKILEPPVISRAGAALTCSCLAAFGCWWLFRLFLMYYRPPVALAVSAAFPATTIYLAYARSAWDVLGACCLICGTLCYSAGLLRGTQPARSAILGGITLAVACSFRFSLAPFLVPSAALVLWSARRAITPRVALTTIASFAVLMVPSLIYNQVRTGSVLRPAVAATQYIEGANALTGNMVHGLFGLFLSPNRGLFVFCPFLLMALFLPLAWRRVSTDQRILLATYGAGAMAYALLIAKLANWGTFGWGPRYLLPVLPVFFVAATAAASRFWTRARVLVLGLALVSIGVTAPTAVVNWSLALATFPGAADPDAPRPYLIASAWRTLGMGMRGQHLPVPAEVQSDPIRATTAVFPDLLLVRLARYSTTGALAALVLGGLSLTTAAFSVRRILTAPLQAG